MKRDPVDPTVVVCPAYGAAVTGLEEIELGDGTQAIEVVAVAGDRVLDVQHLPPPTTERRARTWYLIGAGALAIAAALAMFGIAVGLVTREKVELQRWVERGRDARLFPGRLRLAPHVDVVAFGLFGIGLVGIGLGLRRRADERAPRDYTVGPGGTFELAAGERHPLVAAEGLVQVLNVRPDMRAFRWQDAGWVLLHEARWPIEPGARAAVDAGGVRFLVSSVPAPRRHHVPLFAWDWAEQVYAGGSGVAHAFLVVLLLSLPPSASALSLDLYERVPPKLPERTIPASIELDVVGGRAPGAGRPLSKGPEGEAGNPKQDKRKRGNRVGTRTELPYGPTPAVDPRVFGLVQVLGTHRPVAHSDLFKPTTSAFSGEAQKAIWGRLDGRNDGDGWGNEGDGIIGRGRRGGGLGDESVPLGTRFGIKGGKGGGGPGNDLGIKRALALGGTHRPGPVDPIAEPPIVRGTLDKSMIRRVVRQHVNQVKFCYERRAQLDATLEGKVVVQWTIATNGTVPSSAVVSSTLADPEVGRCVADAVRTWTFPPSPGLVTVTYPFHFKLAGE